mmetsp:Transcript_13345/g.31835  ORF Transcript_13345/g.31835 Transcript_13345/m.31835 type:complete len:120 (+) Transcript_13345:1123-1482(+)
MRFVGHAGKNTILVYGLPPAAVLGLVLKHHKRILNCFQALASCRNVQLHVTAGLWLVCKPSICLGRIKRAAVALCILYSMHKRQGHSKVDVLAMEPDVVAMHLRQRNMHSVWSMLPCSL